MDDANAGNLRRARNKVVGEIGTRRLPVGAKAHLFVKRRPDALGDAAVDLAVDDHRIEENAAVLDDDVVEDVDRAGFGVDEDRSRVGGVAERPGVALCLVARRHFEPARVGIGGQILRPAVPRARDLGD